MAQNLGDNVTIYDYYAKNGYISGYVNGGGETEFTSYTLIANQSMTLTGRVRALSDDATLPATPVFQAPKIIINNTGSIGILIRSDNPNNSMTFNDSSVNFDNAIYNGNNAANRIGPISFTGTSSINITSNTNGKTIIKASTLTGTVTLDVEDGVQDGDTFLIEATDNQLVITDGEWSATASTSGSVTTYTLAKSEPVPVPVIGKYNKKLLRKKLALMLANLKKKRKYYCEVEYIESTGTQYIDTGIEGKDGITAETRIQRTTTSSNECFVGAYNTVNRLWLVYTFGGQWYRGYNTTAGSWTPSTPITDWYTVKSSIPSTGTVVFDCNGTSISSTYTTGFNTGVNVQLFQMGNTGTNHYPAKGKMSYCKIYNNGALVRDFIPVLDWNMTPCMYDRVTEQLFYNQGTGDFVAGREIHPVEYLETTSQGSTSTTKPWINTLVNYWADFEIGVKLRASASNVCLSCGGGSYRLERINATNPYWRFQGGGSGYNYDSTIPITEYHVLKWKDGKISCDGEVLVEIDHLLNSGTYTTLFTNSTASGNTVYPNVVYFLKMWNPTDGTLVRDYIPAIDENGVGFMFDRVSHTIYDNAGTGAFKYPGKEVEYLQSDGARAILAGVTVDDTCGYDVKWMALNANDRIIMGTKGAGDSRWVLSGSNNPNVNLSWNTNYGSNGLGLNKIQTAQMNYFNDRKRILNDTPLEDITQTLSTYASTYNVGIFAGYWGATTISLYSTCRIYYAKISKGTELVRDFIPMVKDGSPCLYDKVGGEYYFGIGTGSFTTGKIVEPEYE